MPKKKQSPEQKQLKALIQWSSQQQTYLTFFIAILLVTVMIMDYFILLELNPQLAYIAPLYALVVTLTAFGIILIISMQLKKAKLFPKL